MENEILDYVMETPGNTNPVILKQMLDANSGTKLPEPTPEDNGKVLGVSEGQYALVSGGGGGGSVEPLIVTLTTAGATTTANKTWKEIHDAAISGKSVIGRSVSTDEGVTRTYEDIVSSFESMVTESGEDDQYVVYFGYRMFTTGTPTGYPEYSDGEG